MTNFSSSPGFLLHKQEKPATKTLGGEYDERETDEEKARHEWDFRLSTVVSNSPSAGAVSDVLGVLSFDPSDNLLATGGIARKIRVYSAESLLLDSENDAVLLDHAGACGLCICTPAKLSSLRWKPGWGNRVIGSGDYDGVVTEYDLETSVAVFERDEHGGRRVWSMDYSHWDPAVGASGSDDGTMQTWDPRCPDGKCLGSVRPSPARSPVCCVEFSPFFGPLLAAGCADSNLYAYDARMMPGPLFVLDGHLNAVTYVKFLDHRTAVTAAVDGSLKTWDTDERRLVRSYKGHVNTKRFVGLSVWTTGGLLCCGSENNQVFVYDKRWGQPIWAHSWDRGGGGDGGFIGSVCWMQRGYDDKCTLVAGGSDGVLKVFNGKRIEDRS
nr:WD repeat-containing protein RUP2-like [Ipomoea trifida]